MPDMIRTPARVTAGPVKTVLSGWLKSMKVALRIGWLRGAARSQRFRRPRVRVMSARAPEIAAAVLAGAGAQYLLDPADGKRRRHVLRDRGVAAVTRLGRRGAVQARYAAGHAEGALHEATSSPDAPADDQALADRVRTEIFRRPDAPKGSVNVSAVDGMVYLRGEIESEAEIERLISDARQVPGVRAVESRLHTPGTPAPMGGAA